jgi:transcription antitermination factor NusA-like protein
MAELTQYPIVIRAVGAPPAPSGVDVVDLVLDEDEPAASVIDGLRASDLRYKDLQTTTAVFLAPEGAGDLMHASLMQYTALYGFTDRLLDVYAGGEIVRLERIYDLGTRLVTRIRQPGVLMWAQVGGVPVAGMPTVDVDSARRGLVSPHAVMMISQAARLRMVPPARNADAFALLGLVTALRRRDGEVRSPFLSTGTEPVPIAKNDPFQGIDLEKIRRDAESHRIGSRASNQAPEVVVRKPVSTANQLLADANAVDIRSVLERLGGVPDENGGWQCPRPHERYPRFAQETLLDFSGDNRTRCRVCDRERIGPVRLVVGTRQVTPDEAARFVLEDTGADLTGTVVTAHVEARQPDGYACAVLDPVTGDRLSAVLRFGHATRRKSGRHELTAGDTVVALVTAVSPGLLELSADKDSVVERLLSGFVHELQTGDIVVERTARVPGGKTKIAVAPTVRGLDARGACIGEKACRVKGAQKVLNGSHDRGEKVEVILYRSKRAAFLNESFLPAKVVRSKIGSGLAVVVVDGHAVGGAVGRGGLNAELAGRLTGLYVKVVKADADLDHELRSLAAERSADRQSRA